MSYTAASHFLPLPCRPMHHYFSFCMYLLIHPTYLRTPNLTYVCVYFDHLSKVPLFTPTADSLDWHHHWLSIRFDVNLSSPNFYQALIFSFRHHFTIADPNSSKALKNYCHLCTHANHHQLASSHHRPIFLKYPSHFHFNPFSILNAARSFSLI